MGMTSQVLLGQLSQNTHIFGVKLSWAVIVLVCLAAALLIVVLIISIICLGRSSKSPRPANLHHHQTKIQLSDSSGPAANAAAPSDPASVAAAAGPDAAEMVKMKTLMLQHSHLGSASHHHRHHPKISVTCSISKHDTNAETNNNNNNGIVEVVLSGVKDAADSKAIVLATAFKLEDEALQRFKRNVKDSKDESANVDHGRGRFSWTERVASEQQQQQQKHQQRLGSAVSESFSMNLLRQERKQDLIHDLHPQKKPNLPSSPAETTPETEKRRLLVTASDAPRQESFSYEESSILTSNDSSPAPAQGYPGTPRAVTDCPIAAAAAASGTDLGWAQSYTLREIEVATNGFAHATLLGEGGYGKVYKGELPHGNFVAVKNLLNNNNNKGQAQKEFLMELEAIGRVRHKNLVRLLGYCADGAQRMLVYEYVDNGNLEQWLHGPLAQTNPLTWLARMRIVLGTAKALTYLHEALEPKVVHRDIKASNILVDTSWDAKVSDFGLAELLGSNIESHITT